MIPRADDGDGAMLIRGVCIAVLVATSALVTGCGGSDSPSVQTASIVEVSTVEGSGHTLFLLVETKGACVGTQRSPVLQAVDVKERPADEVVLTASVRSFPNSGSECAGIGLVLRGVAHTRRPARQLAVYDGGESPARHLRVSEVTQREFWREMSASRRRARDARPGVGAG